MPKYSCEILCIVQPVGNTILTPQHTVCSHIRWQNRKICSTKKKWNDKLLSKLNYTDLQRLFVFI